MTSWSEQTCPHGQGTNGSGLSVRACQDGGNGICDCFIDLEAYLAQRAEPLRRRGTS